MANQLLSQCTAWGTAEDNLGHAGVQGFHAVPVETLCRQIDCVLADIGADVVKTGMLPSAQVGMPTAHKFCQGRKRADREPLTWDSHGPPCPSKAWQAVAPMM